MFYYNLISKETLQVNGNVSTLLIHSCALTPQQVLFWWRHSKSAEINTFVVILPYNFAMYIFTIFTICLIYWKCQ